MIFSDKVILMESLANTLNILMQAFLSNMGLVFACIGSLWLIQILNKLSGYRLNHLGIWPRHPSGLAGIFIAPFLHGSFEHLFLNSMVLSVLLNFMLLLGLHTCLMATIWIITLGGGLLWLLGRPAIHIGASGLIMGYWGFLLVSAYHLGSMFSILIALMCLYFFSSLIFNLFPIDKVSSWEGHLFGFIAGILAVYLLR